jgi:hypothetical protein
MDKLQNKIKLYIDSYNYKISNENLSLLTEKILNSNLIKNNNKDYEYLKNSTTGGSNLPSEYFGINSGSYGDSNTGTNTSATNNAIRPEITSETFPLNGGACLSCMGGSNKIFSFFSNKDLQYLKSEKKMDFKNKEIKQNKELLNSKLSVKLQDLMKMTKNKNNMIGKVHISLLNKEMKK